MSNTELHSQMIESATLVIHEMKQAKMVETFLADESMRMEIIEACLAEVSRKWEKFAVLVRTNPAFARNMLDIITV